MQDALVAYHQWRATLTPVDQTRLDYLMTDGLPLIVDIVKAAADPQLKAIPVIGAMVHGVVDAALDEAGRQAIKALVG